jgi:hypothetical protein
MFLCIFWICTGLNICTERGAHVYATKFSTCGINWQLSVKSGIQTLDKKLGMKTQQTLLSGEGPAGIVKCGNPISYPRWKPVYCISRAILGDPRHHLTPEIHPLWLATTRWLAAWLHQCIGQNDATKYRIKLCGVNVSAWNKAPKTRPHVWLKHETGSEQSSSPGCQKGMAPMPSRRLFLRRCGMLCVIPDFSYETLPVCDGPPHTGLETSILSKSLRSLSEYAGPVGPCM